MSLKVKFCTEMLFSFGLKMELTISFCNSINVIITQRTQQSYSTSDEIPLCTVRWPSFGHRNPGWAPKAWIVGCKRHRREPSGSDLEVWGNVVRSPSRVRGRAPAASNVFVYTDKIWANFWPRMRKHTAAEMGKLGQNFGMSWKIWDVWSPYLCR